jgi:CRP-like cAMP-binding protein
MFDKFKANFPQLKEKWDEYVSYYHRIEVPTGTILLKEGEVSKKAFMIEKGCLRVWFNNNGKDITFQFFFENEAVSSAESFRKKFRVYSPLKRLNLQYCIGYIKRTSIKFSAMSTRYLKRGITCSILLLNDSFTT